MGTESRPGRRHSLRPRDPVAEAGVGRLVTVGADEDAPDLGSQGVDDPGDGEAASQGK